MSWLREWSLPLTVGAFGVWVTVAAWVIFGWTL